MNFSGLVRRGLAHYRRTHLGVMAGATIATATLVGALVVGDSVRYSLKSGALERIGRVHSAMSSGDRFFRSELGAELDGTAAPLVAISGTASSADESRRLHDLQVFGVDERFFRLAPEEVGTRAPAAGEALMNAETARRLKLAVDDEIVLRVELPSALPRDMALDQGDVVLALRLRIAEQLPAASFADFGLRGGSTPRPNVFVDLGWLQEELELEGRANLLLSSESDVDACNASLAAHWDPTDAQIEFHDLEDGRRELRTSRIFFDEPILEVLEGLEDVPLEGVFTYFVNGLRVGDHSVPYSMVTGLGPLNSAARARPSVESEWVRDLSPEQILINAWAAEDLGDTIGATVELDYFVVDASRQLVERTHNFELAGSVSMTGVGADAGLMPDFPGLADADNCRDWEPGTPVDLDRIRDRDEDYWDEYGGTPKAFVRLDDARELWASRFGALTAVRFPAESESAVRRVLRDDLAPAEVGLFFLDVRTPALNGGDSATDFGGLFIGLSFFLIVSALLLASQLFLFGVEQRSRELGLYGALGFSAAFVRRLLMAEVLVLAVIGGGVGAVLGLGYTQFVLWGLSSVWRDAIASVQLDFHAEPTTVVLGFALSVFASVGSAWLALRKALRSSAVRLLSGTLGMELQGSAAPQRSARRNMIPAVIGLALALVIVFAVDPGSGPSAAGAFFGAGALVLLSALLCCRQFLRYANRSAVPSRNLTSLGRRNSARRPGRSLATVALMGIGTFLVVAVGANRLGPTQDVERRSSGTGGFALFGQSSLPVVQDMNDLLGRESLGLDEEEMRGVQVVPMRVLPGDDASCLNLARPQAPPLFGVQSSELSRRQAFSFAATATRSDDPWSLLAQPLEDGVVPAIGDVTSLTWQMHLGVGDGLTYTDERGQPFEVRIVGAVADSILQGALLIEESRFEELFPTSGGHRRFLIDVPLERADAVSASLSRGLRDLGFAVESTGARLDAFHSVQNAYLTIFQALGGLGLLLGSVGLGMVLLRNTLERRAELALAAAVGFAPQRVRWWVFSEYGYLLLLGLGSGALAALVAILPAMRAPGSDLSLASFWIICGAVAASGVFWLWLATRVAVQRAPLAALSEE